MCSSSCPEFDGYIVGMGSAMGECEICSARLYEDDEYIVKNEKILCKDCAEELISPELLDFLGIDNIKEFFDMLL